MTRPRISEDFLTARRRDRLTTALARSVVKKGYHATTVADVVSEAHVARNTFYDNFGSKQAAAVHLVADTCPSLDLGDFDSCAVLAVEIASRLKLGDPIGTLALMSHAEQLLDSPAKVEPLEQAGIEGHPLLSTLPPGRHGLDREFVTENQRTRLLAGTARAVYERGYRKATIADITRHAAVSRRTFYEHFDGKESAVAALLDHAEIAGTGVDLDSGLGHLWAEVVGAAFCGDDIGSELRRKRGQAVVRMLGAQIEAA